MRSLVEQFETLIEISTLVGLVMYGWCAVAAFRIAGQASSPAARLTLRVCGALALAFCIWAALSSDLKLLLASLGFLALTVPLWLGVRMLQRARTV